MTIKKKKRGRRTARGILISKGKLRKSKENALHKDRKFRKKDALLRFIYSILIKPILRQKPDNYERDGWIEEIWAIEDYPIKRFKVLNTFSIPGRIISYYGGVHTPVDYKSIEGSLAIARFNKKESVDLEMPTNTKNQLVFNLNLEQWASIEGYLKELS